MTGLEDLTASAAPSSKVGFAAWWMVAVLLLLNIMSMVDRQILTILVVPIQQDLKLTDFQMSLVLGPALAIISSVAALPLGWASDRFSRRWVLFCGAIFWSAGCTASGLAKSLPSLFAARAAVAIGEASLFPSAFSLIADRFPRRRLTTALAVFGLGPKLGIAAAFALGGAAIALSERLGALHVPFFGELASWRLAVFMVGAPGILLAFLVWTFGEPAKTFVKPQGVDRSALIPFIADNKQMLGLLLGGFCLMASSSAAINAWAPTFITRHFGWSASQFAAPMTMISLIGAAAIVPKGMIIDWLYSRGVRDAHIRFFTWLQLAGLPLIIVAFMMGNVWTFFLLYGLINVIVLSYTLYLSAVIQIVAPSQLRAQLTAAFFLVTGLLASMIGPTSVAAITDFVFHDQAKVGISIVFVAGISLALSCILLRFSLIKLKPFITAKEGDNTLVPPVDSRDAAPPQASPAE